MERSYDGTSGAEESFMPNESTGRSNPEVKPEGKPSAEAERDRDRLISKGQHVLDLCVEQNKLLCVQGFVDSQLERGGVYLEVVTEMKSWIEQQLAEAQGRSRQRTLRDLHAYVVEALHHSALSVAEVAPGVPGEHGGSGRKY